VRRQQSSARIALPLSNPFAGKWRTTDAFAGLEFDEPLTIVQIDPVRYVVVERTGRLKVVTVQTQAPGVQTFLDLSSRVMVKGEAGLLGFTIHPGFGTGPGPESRYVYVFYVTKVGDTLYDRLSRFEVTAEGQADPSTELILIDQFDRDTDHNAGQLQFGPDGFLYVGVGDEGGIADQFGNAQHIDKNLFSGILRLDVDCQVPSRSHSIRRQPLAGHTQGYCIPNDNPFVGRRDALEEFWAIGFRNPWRFSFDSTGLWGADVGQDRREEVFVATAGSNHQWSYREGTMLFTESPLHGQRPDPITGTETMPLFDYPHTNGNGAIIGGYVYRGKAFPELLARYVFGDYDSGRVWALEVPLLTGVAGVPRLTSLLQLPANRRLVSFGRDRDGELFLLVFPRSVLRLQRAE
jgi:glucose/arabinose dehydrogenase